MFKITRSRNELLSPELSKWITSGALVCLPFATSPLFAESDVDIFGIVDVGILYQSETAAGGDSTSMETSGIRQSILGFKGSRELKHGLTGFINLEAHFDTDNGFFHGSGDADGSSGLFFRRQANVGLKGDWGSLTLGRQYGPALLAHIGTEPRAFKEQFSNLYAWAFGQLFTTANPLGGDRNTQNDVGIFFSDAIQYRHTIGPVNFGVLYSLGGTSDSEENNSVFAFGGTYNGPVTASLSYQVMKDEETGNENIAHSGVGLAVPYGPMTFKVNYLNAINETRNGVELADVDGISVGMDYQWGDGNLATIAYYDNQDDVNSNDQAKSVVISNDFNLGKNTTLYVQAAHVDADDAATLRTTIVAAGTPAGKKTTLLNVGVNYAF